jgi:hypothetical protein
MGRTISLISLLVGLAFGWPAWAAPADDGQTAGSRAWVLDQARLAVAITPDDSNDLATAPTRYIYTAGVVTTGAPCVLVVRMADGGTTSSTFSFLAAGVLHKLQVKRILATGTTCVGIQALY